MSLQHHSSSPMPLVVFVWLMYLTSFWGTFIILPEYFLDHTDLLNVFEVFLPQLLLYPNPSDPLNGDAASLMMKDKQQYEQKVKGEFLCFVFVFFMLQLY